MVNEDFGICRRHTFYLSFRIARARAINRVAAAEMQESRTAGIYEARPRELPLCWIRACGLGS